MKQKFFLIILPVICGIGLMLQHCSDDNVRAREIPEGTYWQPILEKLITSDASTKSEAPQVKLLSYTYRGRILNNAEAEQTVASLFAPQSPWVIYPSVGFKTFYIGTIQEAEERGMDLTTLKNQMANEIKSGMDVIDLEWAIKGQSYHSLAVVIGEGETMRIYDNIGAFIIQTPEVKIEEHSVNRNLKEVVFSHADTIFSSFGEAVAVFRFHCSSYFDVNGVWQTYNATSGWECAPEWTGSASIVTSGGEVGKSKYHELTWSYNYAAKGESNYVSHSETVFLTAE